jgi:hypothetical protein
LILNSLLLVFTSLYLPHSLAFGFFNPPPQNISNPKTKSESNGIRSIYRRSAMIIINIFNPFGLVRKAGS